MWAMNIAVGRIGSARVRMLVLLWQWSARGGSARKSDWIRDAQTVSSIFNPFHSNFGNCTSLHSAPYGRRVCHTKTQSSAPNGRPVCQTISKHSLRLLAAAISTRSIQTMYNYHRCSLANTGGKINADFLPPATGLNALLYLSFTGVACMLVLLVGWPCLGLPLVPAS